MAKEFTEIQPKDGDKMLHCGHIDKIPIHFFRVGGGKGGMPFMRPDGTKDTASWIVACDDCFNKAGGKRNKETAKNIQVRGDGTWIGNEPEITTEVEDE